MLNLVVLPVAPIQTGHIGEYRQNSGNAMELTLQVRQEFVGSVCPPRRRQTCKGEKETKPMPYR